MKKSILFSTFFLLLIFLAPSISAANYYTQGTKGNVSIVSLNEEYEIKGDTAYVTVYGYIYANQYFFVDSNNFNFTITNLELTYTGPTEIISFQFNSQNITYASKKTTVFYSVQNYEYTYNLHPNVGHNLYVFKYKINNYLPQANMEKFPLKLYVYCNPSDETLCPSDADVRLSIRFYPTNYTLFDNFFSGINTQPVSYPTNAHYYSIIDGSWELDFLPNLRVSKLLNEEQIIWLENSWSKNRWEIYLVLFGFGLSLLSGLIGIIFYPFKEKMQNKSKEYWEKLFHKKNEISPYLKYEKIAYDLLKLFIIANIVIWIILFIYVYLIRPLL